MFQALIAVLAALLAACLVTLGSVVVMIAPGDGQTAMAVLPLWGLGVLFGLIAALFASGKGCLPEARFIVEFLALAAFSSVLLSVAACAIHSTTKG